jgi:uncharacterized protein YjeT (DUF2065 family)
MENLSAILTPIIDRALRIIGTASLAVIAVFLIWWLS